MISSVEPLIIAGLLFGFLLNLVNHQLIIYRWKFFLEYQDAHFLLELFAIFLFGLFSESFLLALLYSSFFAILIIRDLDMYTANGLEVNFF